MGTERLRNKGSRYGVFEKHHVFGNEFERELGGSAWVIFIWSVDGGEMNSYWVSNSEFCGVALPDPFAFSDSLVLGRGNAMRCTRNRARFLDIRSSRFSWAPSPLVAQ